MTKLFALDHNFPEPIVSALDDYIVNAELVPIRTIDPALSEVDDWEIFAFLYRHERNWDGLITSDAALLSLPKEMSVLRQTQLSLVVVEGQGHNPVRATGALLSHLDHISQASSPKRAQIWRLREKQPKKAEIPDLFLQEIAGKRDTDWKSLYKEHRLSKDELEGS